MLVELNLSPFLNHFFTDLTDASSFNKVKFWVNELRVHEEVWAVTFFQHNTSNDVQENGKIN